MTKIIYANIFDIKILKSDFPSCRLMFIHLPGSLSAAPNGTLHHCESGSVCAIWKQPCQWKSPAERILWKCSSGQYSRLLLSVTYQGKTKLKTGAFSWQFPTTTMFGCSVFLSVEKRCLKSVLPVFTE